MLEVYAAWTEGATAADIEAIKRAMESGSRRLVVPTVVLHSVVPQIVQTGTDPLQAPGFATNTPPGHARPKLTCGITRKNVGGERGSRLDLAPQCAGLYAISLGLSATFSDDQEMLRHGLVMYDALYAWCAHLQDETHGWPPADYRLAS
jgi:Chromate resistance exported protein